MRLPYTVGAKSACDVCPCSAATGSGLASEQREVGIIQEITVGSTRAVEDDVPEWEELELAVDSGASATVVAENMVKAVQAQNARPDVRYEVAAGSQLPHLGRKTFSAFTDGGLTCDLKAEVTEVNKAPLSVSRIVSAGSRVVFDSDGSYIERKASGEWMPLKEKGGIYTLKVWIPREQSTPF